MLLRSIRLKNFRQYKGEQTITFSCDEERNVTVILGDNTSGKTTLVQAFNWVLYGDINFPTKNLLNVDVERQMQSGEEETVEVEVCLKHDNIEYIISRSQGYRCEKKQVRSLPVQAAKVYKKKDGQTEPIRRVRVDSTIKKILPQELSDYFFFDGERISNISNKRDLTESVKGLLGLTVLDNAMYHLGPNRKGSAIGKLRESLDVVKDQKVEGALRHIESSSERRDYIKEELDNVTEQIRDYQELKEETENILRKHRTTAELQKKRDSLNRYIKTEEDFLRSLEKQLINDFNSNAIGFFAQPLMDKALFCLQESDVSDRGIPHMDSSSIDYIIERGVCICGEKIKEGSSKYAYLIRERDFLPPQHIGTMIQSFKERMGMYRSMSENYYEHIRTNYENIRRCKIRVQDFEDEAADISSRIKDEEDVNKHEANLVDYKRNLQRFEAKRNELLREDGALQKEIEACQRLYDDSVLASDKNKQIRLYIRYAEAIYDWIRVHYEAGEREIREELERSVNNIFSQMYHGSRTVEIDDKYRVRLLTAYGDDVIMTDESRGLETVKNFAFIGGLVNLAREKIKKGTGVMDMSLSSEPYPLVMDAPFSHADEKHVSNISKVLPEIAEQVIMALTEKDWRFAEHVMGDKVGKTYFLDKQSETLTYIRESV